MRVISKFIAAALIIYAGATTAAFAQSTGKATTNPPTYLNNSNSPLSLDLNGNLRVVQSGSPGTSDVNVVGINGVAPSVDSGTVDTGTLRVVLPTDQPAVDVVCTSGCVAGSGTVNGHVTTAPPTYSDNTDEPISIDTDGNLRVIVGNASIPVSGSVTVSGTVTANQGGTWNIGTLATITNPVAVTGTFWQATQPVSGTFWQATQPVSGTFWQSVQPTSPTAAVTGGATPFHLIAANSNNSTLIGSAGTHVVYSMQATNNSATIAYAKLYDKATAPTCGTDTPIATLIIPGAASGGAGSNVDFGPVGLSVSLGLGLCVVTGIADNDNTAVAATTYAVNISYK